MKQFFPNELFDLARKLDRPIYVVGGAVRNYLIGFKINATDIDICGDFDPQLFDQIAGLKRATINKRLGTCQILTPFATIEYTRFRTEEYKGGAHTPTSVSFHDSIDLDAQRRDFTCNSVYYDILNDKLIDSCGGIDDINNKLIRVINDKTFKSDGLRIMRAVRFAAQLGFSLEENTASMLASQVALLGDISPERKRDELEKILRADTKYNIEYAHYRGLELMSKLGIFYHVIPEIEQLRGVKQNPKYHVFDVLEHTLNAVKYAREDVRLAALLHDTGKPACLDSEGHMKGHNVVSEKIARVALGQGRLNYSNRIINETAKLCYLHMYDLKGETSDAKMRIFVAENFDIIDKIAALREADGKATGMPTNQKFNRFLHFKQILIDENAPLSISDLKISGEIFEELSISPNRRAALLKELLDACIIDPKLNTFSWLSAQIKKASLE